MIRKTKWKGCVALAIACLVSYFALLKWASLARQAAHGGFPGLGAGIGLLLRFAVAGYCVFVAYRHLSQATINNRWMLAGWGRIFAGIFILAICVKNLIFPRPNQFQPSNEAQLMGAMFVKIIFLPGLAIGLLVWGIAQAFRKSEAA